MNHFVLRNSEPENAGGASAPDYSSWGAPDMGDPFVQGELQERGIDPQVELQRLAQEQQQSSQQTTQQTTQQQTSGQQAPAFELKNPLWAKMQAQYGETFQLPTALEEGRTEEDYLLDVVEELEKI